MADDARTTTTPTSGAEVIPYDLKPSDLVPVPFGFLDELAQALRSVDWLMARYATEVGPGQKPHDKARRRRSEDARDLIDRLDTWLLRAAVHHGRFRLEYAPRDAELLTDAPEAAARKWLEETKELRNVLQQRCIAVEEMLKQRAGA